MTADPGDRVDQSEERCRHQTVVPWWREVYPHRPQCGECGRFFVDREARLQQRIWAGREATA